MADIDMIQERESGTHDLAANVRRLPAWNSLGVSCLRGQEFDVVRIHREDPVRYPLYERCDFSSLGERSTDVYQTSTNVLGLSVMSSLPSPFSVR